MSLSDQTLAFYLSLDASPWDAATKRVEADFKKFVDRLDKATTVVSKGPQVALNKMADAFDAVASKAAKAAGIVAQFDKTLSSGKAVRVPIEFVFSGSGAAGFRQAISEAFRQALGGSRMTMTPVVPQRSQPGFKAGTNRGTYRGMPTPQSYELGFTTSHGTGRPVRSRAQPGPSPYPGGRRVPMGPAVPTMIHGGEAVTSASMSNLIEAMVRQAAVEGWGGVSTKLAHGAWRLRGNKDLKRETGTHIASLEGLQDLYMRRDTGEKISSKDIRSAHAQVLQSYAEIKKVIDAIKDPSARSAGALYLRQVNKQMAELHSNAEVSGTIFDPRHWAALANHSNPVVRGISGWLASHPVGRQVLGSVAMGAGVYRAYEHSGGLSSAMTANDMAVRLAQAFPGMSRSASVQLAAQTLGKASSVITREELAHGLGASTSAGIRYDNGALMGSAEYLAQAGRGYGLDAGVGAGLLGQFMNQFGRSLKVATSGLDKFAGQARESRISINDLGQVAMEAAGAASESDYRTGGGQVRVEHHVTGFGAATKFFGGGQGGARAAAPLGNLALRLQQGDVNAVTSGSMLFGGAAVEAVRGKANTTDLLRNLNYGFLQSMVGRTPYEMQAMSQIVGVPYETLALMVGKVGKGERITEADLAGPGALNAERAARATRGNVEQLGLLGRSLVDRTTALAPETAIDLGFGHSMLNNARMFAEDVALGYGGAKLFSAGANAFGVGAGAAGGSLGSRVMGAAGRVLRPGVRLPVLPGAATATWGSRAAAPFVGARAGLAATGASVAGLGTLGTLGLGGAIAGAGGLAVAGGMDTWGRDTRITGYIGKDGVDKLAAIGKGEQGWGSSWNSMVNFSGAYATDVKTLKSETLAGVRSAIEGKFAAQAGAIGEDPATYLRARRDEIEAGVAAARSQLEGASTTSEVGRIAGGLSQVIGNDVGDALTDATDRSADYLRQIRDLLARGASFP